MNNQNKANMYLGLGIVFASLVLMFLWVPMDTTTGIAERVRRQYVIGDALAPTLAGVFLLIGGIMVLAFEGKKTAAAIDIAKLFFVGRIVTVVAIAFFIMRYAGPLTVWIANALTDSELIYRQLRGTTPWKQIGYFLGSAFAITAMITLTEGRFRMRTVVIGVVAALGLIAIYDLPFEDLLLPPNGDL